MEAGARKDSSSWAQSLLMLFSDFAPGPQRHELQIDTLCSGVGSPTVALQVPGLSLCGRGKVLSLQCPAPPHKKIFQNIRLLSKRSSFLVGDKQSHRQRPNLKRTFGLPCPPTPLDAQHQTLGAFCRGHEANSKRVSTRMCSASTCLWYRRGLDTDDG